MKDASKQVNPHKIHTILGKYSAGNLIYAKVLSLMVLEKRLFFVFILIQQRVSNTQQKLGNSKIKISCI